jgi:DNA polymerase III gamma/tau subunit
MQTGFAFPTSLTEKYRPRGIADFAGLDKPKRILSNLKTRMSTNALIFVGPSGTGKTTMALAFAAEIGAEVHHVGSQECKLDVLEHLARICHYIPQGGHYHVILCDEADLMSPAAQNWLLSRLDSTAPLPNTMWIFTCNSTERFETRFLSRCLVLEFSSYGMSAEIVALLNKVWQAEGGNANCPNLPRLVKESNNNVRESLLSLERALLES